jgi:hypothetical protein
MKFSPTPIDNSGGRRIGGQDSIIYLKMTFHYAFQNCFYFFFFFFNFFLFFSFYINLSLFATCVAYHCSIGFHIQILVIEISDESSSTAFLLLFCYVPPVLYGLSRDCFGLYSLLKL